MTKDDNKLHLVKSYSSFTVKVNIPSSALTVPTTGATATPIYALALSTNENFMLSTYSTMPLTCSDECGILSMYGSGKVDNMFGTSDIRQIYINDGTDEVLYYDHINGYQISTFNEVPISTFDEMAVNLPLTPELCDKELTIRYVLKDNAKVALLTAYIGMIMEGADYGDTQEFRNVSEFCYITEIDVTHLDTSHTKCMYGMFADFFISMYDIKFVGLDKLDTSNVLDMRIMFYGRRPYESEKINKIDISNFDFSKVKYFNEMFERTAYYDDDIVVGKEKLMEAAENLGYTQIYIFIAPDV